MPEHNLTEQLDNAVQALLAGSEPEGVTTGLKPLLKIASELRNLPRENFKARLKEQLMKTTVVESPKVRPIPEGYRTVTPYIVVREAAQLIDFVKQAFGGEVKFRTIGSAGGIHCEMKVGDSMVMIGGGSEYKGPSKPTGLHLYVENADEVYRRAVEAGATPVRAPQDRPYGDREGTVRDLAGNFWYIGTNQETGHAREGFHSVTVGLNPRGASQMMEFMKNAFGAEEVSRHDEAGVVRYASMKVGTSLIELGEAHGEFQPMPTMFYLYVENVDDLYERALTAGATSILAPADQPYGDRSGGVRDPFGNEWYIATHVKDVPMDNS